MPLGYKYADLFKIALRQLRPKLPNARLEDILAIHNLNDSFGSIAQFNFAGHSIDQKDALAVSSWNVNHGLQISQIAAALKENQILANSDIILLQEVRRHNNKGEVSDLPSLLNERLGFNCAYGAEFLEFDKGKLVEVGNMILSRHELAMTAAIRLGSFYDWYNDKRGKRLGERMALRSTIKKNGEEIAVYCTHLELLTSPSYRAKQLHSIFGDASRYGARPTIIGGDFNFIFEDQKKLNSSLFSANNFDDPFGNSGKCTMNDFLAKLFAHALGSRSVLDRILSRGLIISGTQIHYGITC